MYDDVFKEFKIVLKIILYLIILKFELTIDFNSKQIVTKFTFIIIHFK